MKKLLESGASATMMIGVTTALHEAATLFKPIILELILNLDKGAFVDELDAFGWTPLMHALVCESRSAVKVLSDGHASWLIESSEGTAREIAVRCDASDEIVPSTYHLG